MQQFDNSSASDGTIVLPRYAINMARRVMQLLSATDVLSVTFVRVGDADVHGWVSSDGFG